MQIHDPRASTSATAQQRRGEDRAGATRTVQRALDLLLAAVGPEPGSGATTLSALARATGLSPATASRLLATLVGRGLLRRDADGAYRPDSGLTQLAALVLRDDPLYELAGPHLQQLADETGETASLGIAVDGDRALYLRQAAGEQRVQATAWTGRTIPRAGTAMGAALAGDVEQTGWVTRRRTIEPDVTAIAAPVRNRHGEVVAALTILAPSYRTGDAAVAAAGGLLVGHARELSAALGAPEPQQPPDHRRGK